MLYRTRNQEQHYFKGLAGEGDLKGYPKVR